MIRKHEYSNQFKKDIKKAQKQTSPKPNLQELTKIMSLLSEDRILPFEKKDHNLSGSWKGCRECHIQPNFLLIYRKNDQENSIRFERLGTHSELFK